MTSTLKSKWIYILLIGYCLIVSMMISMNGAEIWNIRSGTIDLSKFFNVFLTQSFFVEMTLLLCVFAYALSKSKLFWSFSFLGFILSIFTLSQTDIKNHLVKIDTKTTDKIKVLDVQIERLNLLYSKQIDINHISKSKSTLNQIDELNKQKIELISNSSINGVSLSDLIYKVIFIIFIQVGNIFIFHYLIQSFQKIETSETDVSKDVKHNEMIIKELNVERIKSYLAMRVKDTSYDKVSKHYDVGRSKLNRFLTKNGSIEESFLKRVEMEMKQENIIEMKLH